MQKPPAPSGISLLRNMRICKYCAACIDILSFHIATEGESYLHFELVDKLHLKAHLCRILVIQLVYFMQVSTRKQIATVMAATARIADAAQIVPSYSSDSNFPESQLTTEYAFFYLCFFGHFTFTKVDNLIQCEHKNKF